MEKDLVHKAIQDPGVMITTGSKAWEELTTRYPYFAAAHLLLLKSWQREGDHRFTDQLHQAAIHTTDRKSLYQFVKNEPEVPVAPVGTKENAPVPAQAVEVASIPEPAMSVTDLSGAGELAALIMDDDSTEVAIAPAPAELKPTQVQSPEVLMPVQPIAAETNEVVEETEETPETEELKPVIHAGDIDPFERNLIVEAVRSSIEAEVTAERSETELAPETAESAAAREDLQPADEDNSFEAYIYRRSRQIHFGDQDRGKPADEEISTEAVGDWLRKPAEEENEEELDENDSLAGAATRHSLSHGSQRIQRDPAKNQKDLIDRFIRSEPQIARGKSAEYTPGNIAKESLEEDFSLVTETMAKLFIAQGKIDKARKAFRKLMELHPEKSIYFAAQLKNLDKTKK